MKASLAVSVNSAQQSVIRRLCGDGCFLVQSSAYDVRCYFSRVAIIRN